MRWLRCFRFPTAFESGSRDPAGTSDRSVEGVDYKGGSLPRLECTHTGQGSSMQDPGRDEVVERASQVERFEDTNKHLVGGFSAFVYATIPPSQGWPQVSFHRWTRHPSLDAG